MIDVTYDCRHHRARACVLTTSLTICSVSESCFPSPFALNRAGATCYEKNNLNCRRRCFFPSPFGTNGLKLRYRAVGPCSSLVPSLGFAKRPNQGIHFKCCSRFTTSRPSLTNQPTPRYLICEYMNRHHYRTSDPQALTASMSI
jgi:hypothetical protein